MAKRSEINKIKVPAVSRAVIEAWPVNMAGLPPRVVNACRRRGIANVGELRAAPAGELLSIRSFGARSLREVEAFFDFCALLERGKVVFSSAPELLERFLGPVALEILIARYALRDPDLAVTAGTTLDAIGRRFGLTRERVRQQMIAIHQDLNTRLAQVCLAPMVECYADFMRLLDGVAGAEELGKVRFTSWLDGLNPCRFLQLLAELQSKIGLQGSLFTLLPLALLQEIEKTAVRFLRRQPRPHSLSDVIAEFEDLGWFRKPRTLTPRLVVRVMEHSDLIGATRDDRFFLFPEGAVYLLATLLAEFPVPVRPEVLVERFNQEVKTASRRQAVYITELLTRSPAFVRRRDRTYRLRK